MVNHFLKNHTQTESYEVRDLCCCGQRSDLQLCLIVLCSGNALMDLGDMDKALDYHLKDLELAQQGYVFKMVQNTCDS